MPTEADFWDRIARKYAAKPVDDPAAYEDTLARTRAYLSIDSRVLELGCGTGTTALKLADAVGHITATDISPEMIAIAEEKLARNDPGNVSFMTGAPESEDGAAPYDGVLAFNLLHLLPDIPATLQAIHTKLKPGGIFISKTGCVAEAGWFLRVLVIPAMQAIGKAPHLTKLRQGDVDRMIRAAGFEITETTPYEGLAPTRFVAARRL